MELGPAEQKMLAKMYKKERSWKRERWIDLAASFIGLLVFVWFSYFFWLILEYPEIHNLAFVLKMTPFAVLWFLLLIGVIYHTLSNWNGQPTRRLLLKFAEQHHLSEEQVLQVQKGSIRRHFLIVICFLIISNFVAAFLLAIAMHENILSKQQVYSTSYENGRVRAKSDFNLGKLILFEADPHIHFGKTGKSDGPFEIWNNPYDSELGRLNELNSKVFVESYNQTMKRQYERSLEEKGTS